MENRKHFYITLISNASQKVHPSNTLSDFKIQLAQRIDLRADEDWEVGLSEFSCPSPKAGTLKPVDVVGEINGLIYCDLISPKFVGSNRVRCLRTFIRPSKHCNHMFKNVYYMPVEKRTFQEISILITNLKGANINYKSVDVPTKVVLHFRRV